MATRYEIQPGPRSRYWDVVRRTSQSSGRVLVSYRSEKTAARVAEMLMEFEDEELAE